MERIFNIIPARFGRVHSIGGREQFTNIKNKVIMKSYNYMEAVTADVIDYINENGINVKEEDREELAERLYDECFAADSVTGNGSGSYTFSTWQAEEYLCHNLDLLAEACEEFGSSTDVLKDGAEACDVTIRCYLLPQAIAAALDEAGKCA